MPALVSAGERTCRAYDQPASSMFIQLRLHALGHERQTCFDLESRQEAEKQDFTGY